MKKIIIILLCIFTFAANAQDNKEDGDTYKSIIKFSTLQFMFNTFQLGWEIRDKNSGSFQINAGVCYVDNDSKYKEGYIGEFQYRLYVLHNETSTSNALHNLYLGPYVNLKHFTIEQYYVDYYPSFTSYTISESFNAYNLGVLAGINNVVAKRFHIDFYIGGGIRTSDSDLNKTDIMDEGFKGIAPRCGIELGVNF